MLKQLQIFLLLKLWSFTAGIKSYLLCLWLSGWDLFRPKNLSEPGFDQVFKATFISRHFDHSGNQPMSVVAWLLFQCQCLEPNVQKRPSPADLLQSDIFKLDNSFLKLWTDDEMSGTFPTLKLRCKDLTWYVWFKATGIKSGSLLVYLGLSGEGYWNLR